MSGLFDLPAGGNWEGGYTAPDGQRWEHIPHEGWRKRRPLPYFKPAPKRKPWWKR